MSPRDPLRLFVFALAGALVASVATASRAAPAPEPVAPPAPNAQLEEAWAALDALELERASAVLEPLVASPTLDPATRARAWLALGLTRASLLDDAGARAAFAAALAIDGALTLPENASPKVRAVFDETRASLLPEGVPTPTPAPVPVAAPTPARVDAEPPPPRDDAPAPIVAEPASPWPLYIASGALAAGSVLAGAGAVAAELDLSRAPPGRTRAEYDATRALGVTAAAVALTLGASAVTVLGAALLLAPGTEGEG